MSFESQVAKAVENIQLRTSAQAKHITTNLLSSIVMTTPVLSGTLRGDWQASQNAPMAHPINRPDKVGDVTIQNLIAQIAALPVDRDWQLYFANNQSYAHRIEYTGYSPKAPFGMVRVNFTRISRFVEMAIRNA
ncbi:tail completion or Neck1 protein [Providencia phage PSTCR4]|uniref:Tail protein n=1 Tax=Providencia phage PSTCR4 TaxID=2783546 RepID=A0A873WRW4_9CAUD|nr:tail completion or Neck1 protein [Providencia phage PSTCR4]QPB12048.1 hypothetical protein [Providencia phage PSTCR4]